MGNRPVHNHELKLQRAAAHLTMLDEQIDDSLFGAHRYVAELHSIHSHICERVLPPLAQYLPDPDWFNSVVQ